MKKEIKNLNVKSLIDELNTAKEGAVVNSLTKAKKTVKREYGYKVLFQSGPDFALNRTTPKTNKTLVSIFSKDTFLTSNSFIGKLSEREYHIFLVSWDFQQRRSLSV